MNRFNKSKKKGISKKCVTFGSMPSGLNIEPSCSMIPIHVAPARVKYLHVCRPTLPKPCTMNVLPPQPGVVPVK